MVERDKRYKNWCGTAFMDSNIFEMMMVEANISYLIWQTEKCPKTNKIHQQWYCEFKSAITFHTMKGKVGNCHFDNRKGTQKQAIDYCMKLDSRIAGPFELGIKKEQGKRSDLSDIKNEIICNSKSTKDLIYEDKICNFQQLRFSEGLEKYKPMKKNMREVKVIWFWGGTGVGKSRQAFAMVSDDYWISGKNLKWFDGYNGQRDVIIDDFRKDFCTFHELLRLLDIYPMRVEIKGGSVNWIPANIYITSCFPPNKVYETREDVKQLIRRITEIIEIKMPQKSGVILTPTDDNKIILTNNELELKEWLDERDMQERDLQELFGSKKRVLDVCVVNPEVE
nr:MAG: replication associated protein [Cressdnaviricota sp.]